MSSPYERVLAEIKARDEYLGPPAPTGPSPLFVPDEIMQFLRDAGWTLEHDSNDRTPGMQKWTRSYRVTLYLHRATDETPTHQGELYWSGADQDCQRISLRMVRSWLRKYNLHKPPKETET